MMFGKMRVHWTGNDRPTGILMSVIMHIAYNFALHMAFRLADSFTEKQGGIILNPINTGNRP